MSSVGVFQCCLGRERRRPWGPEAPDVKFEPFKTNCVNRVRPLHTISSTASTIQPCQSSGIRPTMITSCPFWTAFPPEAAWVQLPPCGLPKKTWSSYCSSGDSTVLIFSPPFFLNTIISVNKLPQQPTNGISDPWTSFPVTGAQDLGQMRMSDSSRTSNLGASFVFLVAHVQYLYMLTRIS